MKILILITILCDPPLTVTLYDQHPLITTQKGSFRGKRDDNGNAIFLGIPYGKINPRNIFGAATPYPKFDTVYEALHFDDRYMCSQTNSQGITIGTINCLYLNIYVPSTANTKNPKPVMVWIHGGAFVEGHAAGESFAPKSLLINDVIVVAINYRLGIFGFMCLDIPEVPGNAGLKDQVLALKWIKENIESFGGDNNNITIFGESAGGMSVNLHLLSSNEKLFHKAIIQSGPANSYWTIVESDYNIPIKIAEELGYNFTDLRDALNLMNENVNSITDIAHYLMISNSDGINQPLTKPCIERKFEGVENFLTEHPINIKPENISDIPVMIGYNNIEFAFQYADIDNDFFYTYDFSDYIQMGFYMNDEINEALDYIKFYYIGDEPISEKFRWEIVNFGSDFIVYHPTQRMADKLYESGTENIYRYLFSYNGNAKTNKKWTGATHGEELPYLFDIIANDQKSSEDQLLIDRMACLWTNFAKYGNPTPQKTELLNVKWLPMTNRNYFYLEINSELKLKSRPFHDRMTFWDLIYRQFGIYQKWLKVVEK